MFTFGFPQVLELAKKIKEKTNAKIILGGAHPSAVPKECLKNKWIDYIIISEGEKTLAELCSHLTKNKSIKKIDGIAYKEKQKIIINPKKRFIQNLDTLPFPARHLMPMENYFRAHEAHAPQMIGGHH